MINIQQTVPLLHQSGHFSHYNDHANAFKTQSKEIYGSAAEILLYKTGSFVRNYQKFESQ